jgi:hypothetical protein
MARAAEKGGRLVEVDGAPWREAVAPFVERFVGGMDGGAGEALEAIRAAASLD